MTTMNDSLSMQSDVLDDFYLAQNRVFMDQFLAEHGFTQEKLISMDKEQALEIFRQALDYAAGQMARRDAMIRLGKRDADTKMEPQAHHRHTDWLDHWFKQNRKG